MNGFPFRADRKLTDVLRERDFTYSAEVIPPRNGVEQMKVLTQIQTLVRAGAEFIAVTKGAGGSLRGGSLPIAQVVKEQFQRPCIAHFTCRDLTALDVENQLMDHHYFGIRNILALRGDPPDGQPEYQTREGGYRYAYELIQQIRGLNEGAYLNRAGGPEIGDREKTDFCIGAAAYPEHPDPAQRLDYFKLKVDAGAQYGITDMLFDAEVYARYLELLAKGGVSIPILPGSRVLKSRGQAERMMKKFRVRVPASVLARLPEEDLGEESMKRGVELFTELVDSLKRMGAPGIHLFVIADTGSACAALDKLGAAHLQGA